jgi:ribosomal protein L14E/L6E/L27E
LAEAGCTSKQIQAITGHKSLEEVERYTKEAEQVLLAQQAMALVSGIKDED